MDPTSFAALQGAAGGAAGDPVYTEDVFSTQLYDGTGNNQTITNGVDLAGEGGLIWTKWRSGGSYSSESHALLDTERGFTKLLRSDTTGAQSNVTSYFTAASDGYQITTGSSLVNHSSGGKYCSWTFRKCRGFFDVVTYTGNGNRNRAVPHSLGSTPGMIITKRIDDTQDWSIWHKNAQATWTGGTTEGNTTGGNATGRIHFDTAAYDSGAGHYTYVNSSAFGVYYSNLELNIDGATYVSYIFADDDARFGTYRNESIIKCGTYVDSVDIDLGWEPQLILWKEKTGTGNWQIVDNMRGMPGNGLDKAQLYPNTNSNEVVGSNTPYPTSTGFKSQGGGGNTYIYMAIRRPHKSPTVGTDVFSVDLGSAANAPNFTANHVSDLVIMRGGSYTGWTTRYNEGKYLRSDNTDAEASSGARSFVGQYGFGDGFGSNSSFISWMFRRAPKFMDIVSYNATGSSQAVPHNLEVTPEMIIVKGRGSTYDWGVYHTGLPDPVDEAIRLNLENAKFSSTIFNKQAPTSTNFYVNYTSGDHLAFLFATLPGISKVGSYTGTSNAINVDCGFTNGARFVLIKRADSSTGGHWYVFDTAQGINSGNDSYYRYNLTNAQGSADLIDPYNAGFSVASGTTNVNYSGGTYIFLAIA